MTNPASEASPREGIAGEAVRALERDLNRLGTRRWLRPLLIFLGVLLVGGGAYYVRQVTSPPPPARFVVSHAEKRDVIERVQSTGKVKPLKEVQVGAQVSGRVVRVRVDFNTEVKKGDLLAEIDPQIFGAQVSQVRGQLEAARANLQRAEASLATSTTTLKRLQALRAEALSTPAEVDQAQGAQNVAQADVTAAKAQIAQLRAQLASAKTTLEYTEIYSPIDGVVINRAVDPGQTVASNFAAPVLFVIAQDLSKMQVMADVDEADVGKLAEGMNAEVVVDAFPGDVFRGKVTQIRYSPTEVQGVVTYSAVIDVDNPHMKLRPGMTATVSVETRKALGVTAVPNAALRFRPIEKASDGEPPLVESRSPPVVKLAYGQGRLYLPAGGPPGKERVTEKIAGIGITDGVWTEIRSGVKPGDDVVTEQRDAEKKSKFMGLF